MRVHYFLFWTLISSLLFFSCEEEREELTFEDIPHEFTKVGAQNGPPGLELQLLKNDTYD